MLMKSKLGHVAVLAALLIALSGGASASIVGANNITMSDESVNASGSNPWYRNGTYDVNGAWTGEDQEVEPGMVYNQNWDLEGMFLTGTTLTLVGGWNFQNGYTSWDSKLYTSGDIFLGYKFSGDTDPVKYGESGNKLPNGGNLTGSYGYDFVLRVNWGTGAYDIVEKAGGAGNEWITTQVSEVQNVPGSNPFKVTNVKEGITIFNGNFGSQYLLTTEEIAAWGLKGDTEAEASGYIYGDKPGSPGNLTAYKNDWRYSNKHYAVSFDLSKLGELAYTGDMLVHFTQSCGNDNLMGKFTIDDTWKKQPPNDPVPEPASMAIFGLGLAGLVTTRLRKRRQA